jgi:hypothetical protein
MPVTRSGRTTHRQVEEGARGATGFAQLDLAQAASFSRKSLKTLIVGPRFPTNCLPEQMARHILALTIGTTE